MDKTDFVRPHAVSQLESLPRLPNFETACSARALAIKTSSFRRTWHGAVRRKLLVVRCRCLTVT